MTINYIECVSTSYPNVSVSCVGDPTVYTDILWGGGDPLPTEEQLRLAHIDNLRQSLWLAIKDERDTRKAGGIKLAVNGTDYWFWTDDPSRDQYAMLDSMIRRYSIPTDHVLDQWKTMSGVYVTFTVALLHQIIDAGIQNESTVFHVAETHRLNMLAQSDPTDYDFSGGWPQSYQDYLATLQQP